MTQLTATLAEDTVATSALAQGTVVPVENEPAPRLSQTVTFNAPGKEGRP